MEAFIKKLDEELRVRSEAYAKEKSPLRRMALCKQAVIRTIHELKRYVIDHPPTNGADIMRYNKEWYPQLLSGVLYYQKCYEAELFSLSCDEKEKADFCQHELTEIRYFLRRHPQLIEHYYAGDHQQDHIYWSSQELAHVMPEQMESLASDDLARNTLIVAQLLANTAYKDYIQALIRGPQPAADPLPPATDAITWAGSKAELVQLVIALYLKGCIRVNGKAATLEDFKRLCPRLLSISLENLSVIDNKNRLSKNPTLFLEELVKAYKKREDDLLDSHP